LCRNSATYACRGHIGGGKTRIGLFLCELICPCVSSLPRWPWQVWAAIALHNITLTNFANVHRQSFSVTNIRDSDDSQVSKWPLPLSTLGDMTQMERIKLGSHHTRWPRPVGQAHLWHDTADSFPNKLPTETMLKL
jgi:hypothetical protein